LVDPFKWIGVASNKLYPCHKEIKIKISIFVSPSREEIGKQKSFFFRLLHIKEKKMFL